MTYFEHPKFKFLIKILNTFHKAGQPLCIDRFGRVWLTIESLERDEGGCGRCHNSYDGIFITGAVTKHRKRNQSWDVPQFKTRYEANISQYDCHPCCDGETREDDDFPFLFKGDVGIYGNAYSIFPPFRDLVRQYHINFPVADNSC